jgi:hypothetical protein
MELRKFLVLRSADYLMWRADRLAYLLEVSSAYRGKRASATSHPEKKKKKKKKKRRKSKCAE